MPNSRRDKVSQTSTIRLGEAIREREEDKEFSKAYSKVERSGSFRESLTRCLDAVKRWQGWICSKLYGRESELWTKAERRGALCGAKVFPDFGEKRGLEPEKNISRGFNNENGCIKMRKYLMSYDDHKGRCFRCNNTFSGASSWRRENIGIELLVKILDLLVLLSFFSEPNFCLARMYMKE